VVVARFNLWATRLGFAVDRDTMGVEGSSMTVRKTQMKPDFAQYGFGQQDSLIMAFIGGSQEPMARSLARPMILIGMDCMFPRRRRYLDLSVRNISSSQLVANWVAMGRPTWTFASTR
jgi:hypothetical protein